jgi:hypothetical protein
MKKIAVAALILIILTPIMILTQANPAAAGPYAISQLDTGLVSDDLYPAINNRGEIVWYHAACQIQTGDPSETYTETGKYYFYQGGSLTALNVPANNDPPWNYSHPPLPLLNDQGQMGYLIQDYKDDGKYKIYFHNGPGGDPQPASSTPSMPEYVQLNQQGRMAWSNYDANIIPQVYLFDNGQGPGTQITNYTDPSGYPGFAGGLSLNDAGQVVWVERAWDADAGNYVFTIQRRLGGVTQRIHTTAGVMFFTKINNQGQVTWLEQDQTTGMGNIMLYDGNSAQHIPGGDGFLWGHVSPDLQINDQGQVMWLGNSPESDSLYNIFLYSDGATTQITHYTDASNVMIDVYENWDNAKSKFSPRLNNNGEIVWVTKIPNGPNPNDLDLAVHVYGGGQIIQLDHWTADSMTTANWGDAALHAAYAQINDAGQVVWSRYNGAVVPNLSSDFEIYLATPVTLADAVKYLQVLTGTANVSVSGNVIGDNKIGIEDVIYYLQSAAGLR